MFPTDEQSFPIKSDFTFLSSCSVSPMHRAAFEAVERFSGAQMRSGIGLFRNIPDTMSRFHSAAAALLKTSADNISLVRSTAEGLSMVANGYPLQPGDEIISYAHEYPANHYPWRIQEARGAKLVLIKDQLAQDTAGNGRPCCFSLESLEELITARTRLVALSHVQFTSGFAVELEKLGEICSRRGVDLVIDAAQSLGALPLYPERCKIGAIAASGWKWLLGPIGTGILYTSPEFRSKIRPTMGGPELMKQGNDYLNLDWNPHNSGRLFEYSTPAMALAEGLTESIERLFLPAGLEQIKQRIFALQDIFLDEVDLNKTEALRFAGPNRSGIISLITGRDPIKICEELYTDGFIFTSRGGYLRLAPHCYLTDNEIKRSAQALNRRL